MNILSLEFTLVGRVFASSGVRTQWIQWNLVAKENQFWIIFHFSDNIRSWNVEYLNTKRKIGCVYTVGLPESLLLKTSRTRHVGILWLCIKELLPLYCSIMIVLLRLRMLKYTLSLLATSKCFSRSMRNIWYYDIKS